MTTRARREEFLHKFDDQTLRTGVVHFVARRGLSAFSDEALADLVTEMAREWRLRERRYRRNRTLARAA